MFHGSNIIIKHYVFYYKIFLNTVLNKKWTRANPIQIQQSQFRRSKPTTPPVEETICQTFRLKRSP